MRKRTQARELALQMLYQLDLQGAEKVDQIEPFLKRNSRDPEVVEFALSLIYGTWEHKVDIDIQIQEVAQNWEFKRMAAIDRNILRIGTYELLFRKDVPPLVVINEAIDIAKKFSTQNSGQFVNGILDSIRIKHATANDPQKHPG